MAGYEKVVQREEKVVQTEEEVVLNKIRFHLTPGDAK